MASAKGTSQTNDADTLPCGKLSEYYPLPLETPANNAILSPPMADMWCVFILTHRVYTGHGEMQKTIWERDLHRMNSTIWWWLQVGQQWATVLIWTVGLWVLFDESPFHTNPWEVGTTAKLVSSWSITSQPSLKLTNWKGKERAKHNLSLAPQGLSAVTLHAESTEVQHPMK